jgi:hypothetical protein
LTCFYAVRNGQLECLQYAIENGCLWNKEGCLEYAIERNKTLIVNYIKNLENNETSETSEKDKVFNNEAISLNCENCKVNKKCVIYEPCNHLLSCWSCAVKNENCFNCNKKITSLLKIFFT